MNGARLGVILAMLVAAPMAWAAPNDPARLRQQAAQAERERAAQQQAQAQAAARAKAAQTEAGKLAAQRSDAESRLQAADSAVTDAASHLQQLRQQQEDDGAKLRASAARIAPVLPLMERLSLFPSSTLLTLPGGADRGIRGLLVLRGLTRVMAAQAQTVRAQQHQLADLQLAARQQAAQLATARDAQAAQAEALDRQIANAEQTRRAASAAASVAARQAQAAAAKARDLRAAVAELEASRHTAEVKLAKGEEKTASLPPASQPGPIGSPVTGGVVRNWGDSTDAGPASGITYQAAPNARVVSGCDGKVVFAGPFRSYGQLLILDCGRGYHLVLAGMDHLDVAVGRRLRQGEAVGTMPADQPSLYLELRRGDQPVDPAPFLRARG